MHSEPVLYGAGINEKQGKSLLCMDVRGSIMLHGRGDNNW